MCVRVIVCFHVNPGDVLSVFSAIYAISRHFDVDGSSKDTATELFCLLMGRCIDQCRVYWSCIVPCEMFLELVAFPFRAAVLERHSI